MNVKILSTFLALAISSFVSAPAFSQEDALELPLKRPVTPAIKVPKISIACTVGARGAAGTPPECSVQGRMDLSETYLGGRTVLIGRFDHYCPAQDPAKHVFGGIFVARTQDGLLELIGAAAYLMNTDNYELTAQFTGHGTFVFPTGEISIDSFLGSPWQAERALQCTINLDL